MSQQPPGDDDGAPRPGGVTLTMTERLDGEAVPVRTRVDVGMTLGRYRLRERLGEGGMGVVFAAHDPELDRTIAVKVLHPGLGGPGSTGEERLKREGQTMARLAHENVIRVYDVGAQGDVVFVAMEYVAGGTLKQWLAAAPHRPDEILAVFEKAARGLAAAHDAGLVHRDFKPANVLVSDDGRVLVTDFGVARASLESAAAPDAGPVDALGQTVSRGGSLVGTPAYMAPEQLHGRAVDGRADQFSFCVALWRALYGTAPYAGQTWSELADSTARGELVEPPASARVPGHVRQALARGLDPDPEARFPSMRALADALDGGPRRRRNAIVAVSFGAVFVAAIVGAVVHRVSGDPCAPGGERFAGVWDEGARRTVHDAFVKTGAPYAEQSFAEVARQLDARRAAWDAMRRDSCEATRVRKEQSDSMLDLRAACLERSFADVAAFVGLLQKADAATVRRAAQAAASVGDLTPCGDVVALSRRAPLPDDPARRREVAAIESALAGVRANVAADRWADVDKALDPLVARARAIGYAPLTAEALALAGDAAYGRDRGPAAEKLFEESLLAAEVGGDDALRFEDEVKLTATTGYQLEHDADGLRHAARAQALLERLGNDARRQARLAHALVRIGWWNGRYPDARREAEREIALLQKLDPNGVDMARALHMYGVVLQEMKEPEASLAPLEHARKLAEAALGAQHPLVASILQTEGGSLRNLGRYDEATRAYRRGMAIIEAALGPESGEMGAAVQNLGTEYLDEGKFPEAIANLERAAAIAKKVYGPEHSRVADVLEILGSAYSKAGRWPEGEATLLQSVALHKARLGPNAPPTASAIKHLGDHYLRAKQPERAAASYEEAVRAIVASQGDKSPLLVRPLVALGDATAALGQNARAKAAYARALAVAGDAPAWKELRADVTAKLQQLPSGGHDAAATR